MSSNPAQRTNPWWGIAAVVLAVAPVAVAAAVMALQRPLMYFDGDYAYEELDLLNAGHLAQLVGIGERFGWSHPGPAWFYALTVFYAPLGDHSWGFVVANMLLNAITVALIVAVVWRSWGPPMALVSAGALLVYVGVMGEQVFRDIWPPEVLVLTMLLFFVLSAAGAAGSTPALVGALVVGSYAVQLHLGTGPTVAAVVGAAVALRLANRYLDARKASSAATTISPGRWNRPLLLGGLAVVVLMWVPPAIDELTGHPGNLTSLWQFFTADYPKHPVLQAVSVFGRLVTPLEWPRLLTADISRASPAFIAIALLFVAVSAGLAATGTLVRNRFAQSIGTIVAVAAVAVTLSIRDVEGFVYGYLLLWVTCLPVLLFIGWVGVSVDLQPVRDRMPRVARERGVALLAAAVAALSATSVVAVLRLPSIGNAAPDTRAAWTLTAAALDGQPKQPVLVDIYTPDTWIVAAGVALQLEKDGRPIRVRDDWVFMFGHLARTNGSEKVVLAFVDPPDSATYVAQHPGAELIGSTTAHSIFLTRGP